MKPIILVPLVALALVGGSAGAYLAVTSEGSVEEVVVAQPTATPTPAAEPTPTTAPMPASEATPVAMQPPGGAGGDLSETVVPAPTPPPTIPPVPADWATYTDPDGSFALRYPGDWFVPRERRIHSWGPDEPFYPAGGILVDFGRTLLSSDTDPREILPPQGATESVFGGIRGWELVLTRDAGPGHWDRLHQIWADRDGYRFWLAVAFAEQDADETTFLQIANSFGFIE
ncbi:MAG: hypothetical protein IIA91_11005 [Chloroflexi bacterium]|nr:hypothetical protein [Chloroflexota bacterium]